MDELHDHESALARLLAQVPADDPGRADHREALRSRALATFDAAHRQQIASARWKRIFNHGREIMRRPLPRFVLAVAACLAVFAAWLLVPDQESLAQAFNKFAKAIVEAHSATFQEEVSIPGQEKQKCQSYYLAPGKMRNEIKSNGAEAIGIADLTAGKIMILSPSAKTAMIMNMKNVEKDPNNPNPNDVFEQMRDLLAKSADAKEGEFKSLGEKEIDGRRAVGFARTTPTQSLTLWGDPATGLPVLVEMTTSGVVTLEATMSDFKLNDDLDPALFDMTPPEGYTVRSYDVDGSKPTEATLVEMLDLSPTLNDGRFLDDLGMDSIQAVTMKMVAKDNAKDLTPRAMKLLMTISRGVMFAVDLPEPADAHYAGKGVKLGTPNRPIFWYKPEGSKTYRVIFADLAVKDATTAPEVAGAVRVEKMKAAGLPSPPEPIDPAKNAEALSNVLAKLTSIALAMQNEVDVHHRFPSAAIRDKEGKPLLSWRVQLLPYLDQDELFKQFHLDEPWDSEHNLPLAEKMPDCYATHQVVDLPGKTVFLVPTGKETTFAGEQGTSPKEITDGLDKTILLVEADAEHAVTWTKPEDLEIDPQDPAAGLQNEQGFLVIARADGSVVMVSAKSNAITLWSCFTRAGHERTPWPTTITQALAPK